MGEFLPNSAFQFIFCRGTLSNIRVYGMKLFYDSESAECGICRAIKPRSAFYIHRAARARGCHSYCKDCHAARPTTIDRSDPALPAFIQEFYSRAIRAGECWLWSGSTDRGGYGLVNYKNEKRAHRLSYKLAHGELARGVCVLHSCDNPACINPAHLRTGTQAENIADMKAKGRGNQPKGEKQTHSKLTDDQVREIRASGDFQQVLADRYRVALVTISRIIRNVSWKHIR